MRRLILIPLLAGLISVPLAGVSAQEAPAEPEAAPAPVPEIKAKSLDELLRMVRQGGLEERRRNQERERTFVEARQEQQRLLNQSKRTLANAEALSERLEKSFNANEQSLASLEQQLRERLGALGELFGIVRAVSGDTLGAVDSSLVTAQIPGRSAFLESLAQSKELPSIDKLRRLWIIIQEEATETGKIVSFPATVITTEGEQVQKQVTRIGVFNAVADGEYLQFLIDSQQLIELGRQPAGQHVATVDDLEDADSDEIVGFSIDPSRGQILSLLVDLPTVWERIQQGKVIGYIIIFLASIGVALSIFQWVHLILVNRKVQGQLESDQASDDNPLGRVISVFDANRREDVETLELKLDEAVLKEQPGLERFLTTIRVLSVVAPLLGLLGTVTGMIQTFQSITLFGTGDPKMMASGISEALVTTMLGLYSAIPLTLLHSFVSGRSKGILHVLDEQSAGIIARQAESRDAAA